MSKRRQDQRRDNEEKLLEEVHSSAKMGSKKGGRKDKVSVTVVLTPSEVPKYGFSPAQGSRTPQRPEAMFIHRH